MSEIKREITVRHLYDDGSEYDLRITTRPEVGADLAPVVGSFVWIYPDTWPAIRAALDEHFARPLTHQDRGHIDSPDCGCGVINKSGCGSDRGEPDRQSDGPQVNDGGGNV